MVLILVDLWMDESGGQVGTETRPKMRIILWITLLYIELWVLKKDMGF
jgi:hypothetical protein